jgi:hypothetical protein
LFTQKKGLDKGKAQIVDLPLVGGALETGEEKPTKGKLPPVTITALKEILTRVKEELGSDVLKNIFVVHDCKKLGDLPDKEWPTVYAEAEALLNPGAAEEEMDPFDLLDEDEEDDDDLFGMDEDEEDDDLGLDDDDGGDAPSLEDVKKLASKFSDTHGLEKQREVLGKFGIHTTRSLGKATPEQLTKIHAAFTKGLK